MNIGVMNESGKIENRAGLRTYGLCSSRSWIESRLHERRVQ